MKNRNTAAFVLIFLLTITAIVFFARPALVQPNLITQQQQTNSPPELFTPVNPPSVRGRPTTQDPNQQYGADAVSLWVSDMDACGIGCLNKSASEFRNRAFSVVSLDCATGVYSFAHELGHNLGATHDPDNSEPGEGIFPYSHGYQDPDGEFRTIMAYKKGCPGKCPRINLWSNPDRSYNGKPLGIRDRANNAETLSQTL